jgi:hypothetical protein
VAAHYDWASLRPTQPRSRVCVTSAWRLCAPTSITVLGSRAATRLLVIVCSAHWEREGSEGVRKGRLTGGSRLGNLNEFNTLNFVQTCSSPKVIFLSSNNLDKILGDRFWQEEQLLLFQLSKIRIQIWIKIQRRQKLMKLLGIKLKYLVVLEKYQTWHKIFLLHLVAFKNIFRVYYFRVF